MSAECPTVKSKVKSWWSSYGGLMIGGAVCALLGLLVGVWATKDITITIKDKPCQVKPCCPAPEPVQPCPCKPKKPGDTGQFEAGSGCDCPPGDCQCHPKPKGETSVTPRDQGPVSEVARKCGCPKCNCYPCLKKSKDGKCDCPNCEGRGRDKC